MPRPSDREIENELNEAARHYDEGTRWPSMSYEEGVEAALRWAQGDGDPPMAE